ncbi:hypothetical protein QQP08_018778 [Theobroma cacao]|nr:hypothetical protein QQP08_018778 [Theobroma cacao]
MDMDICLSHFTGYNLGTLPVVLEGFDYCFILFPIPDAKFCSYIDILPEMIHESNDIIQELANFSVVFTTRNHRYSDSSFSHSDDSHAPTASLVLFMLLLECGFLGFLTRDQIKDRDSNSCKTFATKELISWFVQSFIHIIQTPDTLIAIHYMAAAAAACPHKQWNILTEAEQYQTFPECFKP